MKSTSANMKGDQMKYNFPDTVTYRDMYGHIVHITDQAEADDFFEACVQHCMKRANIDRQEAETIERSNIGYYAGYFDYDVMERVGKLFSASHPIFGVVSASDPISAEDAIQKGYDLGQKETPIS